MIDKIMSITEQLVQHITNIPAFCDCYKKSVDFIAFCDAHRLMGLYERSIKCFGAFACGRSGYITAKCSVCGNKVSYEFKKAPHWCRFQDEKCILNEAIEKFLESKGEQ